MHQQPRPQPLTASPALSPKTNPTRTNNSREDEPGPTFTKKHLNVPGHDGNDYLDQKIAVQPPIGLNKDELRKLDQIVQNFHTKAAMLVIHSRISLPVVITQDGVKKVNRWFQIETDDTNSFRQELGVWRQCGSYSDRPPPLIIETFIDTSELTDSQSLVIVDDSGKRWDVHEALSLSGEGSKQSSRGNTDVILERWKFELRDLQNEEAHDFGSTLPTVYKKLIVFFRSLYATTKFIPTGRFVRMIEKGVLAGSSIKVNCRILTNDIPITRLDALTHPIFENGNVPVTTDFVLGTIETSVGKFYAKVSYRSDCNFRIDDTEALLSSRFMGVDECFFKPSLGSNELSKLAYRPFQNEAALSDRNTLYDRETIKDYEGLHSSRADSSLQRLGPTYAQQSVGNNSPGLESPPMESLPRINPSYVARSSTDSIDLAALARRPSVSFQPFKAGSLSSSPGHPKSANRGETAAPRSSQSSPRTSVVNPLVKQPNRSSLTAGTPATLRGGPVVSEHGMIPPTSSSPKPASTSKYTSSFSRRRGQSNFGSTSKSVADDDQGSSGKQSLSSSTHPGSTMFAELGMGGPSGSWQTDDDNISEFLKVLDRQKTLKSLETSGESAARRASAQLSRYQSLRESHNALTESMTFSSMLNRSSSSSGRPVSSLPPLTATASLSNSSSPGKPTSPHTPHTPAIPSRLSAHSIVDYTEPTNINHRGQVSQEVSHNKILCDGQSRRATTDAIDIPNLPRAYHSHSRRSSYIPQSRPLVNEDLADISFGIHRSMSAGADHDGDPPTSSTLLRLGQVRQNLESLSSPVCIGTDDPSLPKPSNLVSSQEFSAMQSKETGALKQFNSSTNSYHPVSYQTSFENRISLPQSDPNSEPTNRQIKCSMRQRTNSSCSITRNSGMEDADDESLLFQMSEIGRHTPVRGIDTHAPESIEPGASNEPEDDLSETSNRRHSHRRW